MRSRLIRRTPTNWATTRSSRCGTIGGNPAQSAYFFTVNLFISPYDLRRGARFRARSRSRCSPAVLPPPLPLSSLSPALGDSYSFVAASFRTGDPPPAGRDEMLLAIDSPAAGDVTLTQVHARFFHVDFATPANSTLGVGANHTPNALITVNPFVDAFTNRDWLYHRAAAGNGRSNSIPLGDKIMTPMVYQNIGGTESLWARSHCQFRISRADRVLFAGINLMSPAAHFPPPLCNNRLGPMAAMAYGVLCRA